MYGNDHSPNSKGSACTKIAFTVQRAPVLPLVAFNSDALATMQAREAFHDGRLETCVQGVMEQNRPKGDYDH